MAKVIDWLQFGNRFDDECAAITLRVIAALRNQIETPCPNCDRLERDLNHSAYLSDKRVFERDSAERINERVFKENDFLKKQIEMCKEVLAYYANKNNWDEPRQQTTGIIQLSKINQSDFEDTGNGEGYYIAGKRARECLFKLEKE